MPSNAVMTVTMAIKKLTKMTDLSEKNIAKKAILGANQTSEAFHRSVLM